jgi:hypothetical protein
MTWKAKSCDCASTLSSPKAWLTLTQPNSHQMLDQVISKIQSANLNIRVEGEIQDFLGINISRKEDRSIHLLQLQLIKGILKNLWLNGDQTKIKNTPSMSTKILKRHEDSEAYDGSFFYYRSVVGKLNYLEKGTLADISFIITNVPDSQWIPNKNMGSNQMAREVSKGTCDKGLILKPDGISGLKVYVDADLVGNWDLS